MNQPVQTTARKPSTGNRMRAAIPARAVAFIATPRGRLAGVTTHAPPAYA